jgi:hypothetical protein
VSPNSGIFPLIKNAAREILERLNPVSQTAVEKGIYHEPNRPQQEIS